jgi:POT family proton-dependent oligopeptide transporter
MKMLDVLGAVVGLTFAGAAGAVLTYGFRKLERVQRQQLFAALMLMSIWVCFAAIIEQVGSSIALFLDRVVDRNVFGIEIRAAQVGGLLAFLVILFSPVFAWLWGYLERRNLNPSSPAKFALSLVLLGVGYAALAIGGFWPDSAGRVSIAWVVLLYVFFAIGDLFIVPVGLSAITKLAAREIVGFMMGLWMLSVAIGNYFSALIAKASALEPAVLAAAQPMELLRHYQVFFGYLALGSTLMGVLALACAPGIRKWMHGVR